MVKGLAEQGFRLFDSDPRVLAWARAAADVAREVAQDEAMQLQWLRHQRTWFVGVDALPNAPDGSIKEVPLIGPWDEVITPPERWHKAQISIVYEGYPKQHEAESDANHRFRITRYAAHVDGILLEQGRRYLREPHEFILGVPLGYSAASPLVVWPGSHVIMGDAFRALIGDQNPNTVDLTEGYKEARAEVFRQINPVKVPAVAGQSVLLHRHLLHGVAPWEEGDQAGSDGRMAAYFRPEFSQIEDWLNRP